jgi:hypothetical protein
VQLLPDRSKLKDVDDTGMLHMLHRDLPRAVNSKKGASGDNDEEDEADAATAITTSQSSRGIASRAVHRGPNTAVL